MFDVHDGLLIFIIWEVPTYFHIFPINIKSNKVSVVRLLFPRTVSWTPIGPISFLTNKICKWKTWANKIEVLIYFVWICRSKSCTLRWKFFYIFWWLIPNKKSLKYNRSRKSDRQYNVQKIEKTQEDKQRSTNHQTEKLKIEQRETH